MVKSFLNKLKDNILPPEKVKLSKQTLRNAGIGVIIYDERWKRLFSSIKKPASIVKAEQSLTALTEEKKRLQTESCSNKAEKQAKLSRIIELTDKAFNDEDDAARTDIAVCEARILEINAREPQIEQLGDEVDKKILESNLSLLENAISFMYLYMKKSKARAVELDTQIDDMREALKARISERADLESAVSETYNFLHSLLGAEEIELIDDHYDQ